MIAKLAFITAAALGALTVAGTLNTAQAATTIINHPAACKSVLNQYSGIAASNIAAWEIGVKTHGNALPPVQLICPLVRPQGSGATVYVEGRLTEAGVYIWCTAYSLSYDGTLLAAKSFGHAAPYGAIKFDTGVAFSATEAPSWAALSVICEMPSKGRGIVHGLSVVSY